MFNNSSHTRKERSERRQSKRRSVSFCWVKKTVTSTLLAWRIVHIFILDRVLLVRFEQAEVELMFYKNFAAKRWPPTRAYSMSWNRLLRGN